MINEPQVLLEMPVLLVILLALVRGTFAGTSGAVARALRGVPGSVAAAEGCVRSRSDRKS